MARQTATAACGMLGPLKIRAVFQLILSHSLQSLPKTKQTFSLGQRFAADCKYQSIRKTRRDGNCFFRAVSFTYLESLLNDQQEYTRFKQLAENSKEVLVSLGFQRFTIEDFNGTFMDVLKRIENYITLDDLLKIFNDQGYSDYIVVYMRLLTSGQLQKEASFFASFIDGQRTVQEFCKQEVEPMYK
ncbi:ubiquitin thioesterase OTUB1-like [Dermacentor albipictus]|uniref:ubiquitin thioesterase OTUB1-like n=1 Tax=Dermacentor albipictus TaxID=60249 RepID=UPI0031FDB58A